MLVAGAGAEEGGMEASAPPRLFRSVSGHAPPIRSGPSAQVLEHAKIVLDYFNSLKEEDQTDVEVLSDGRRVSYAHRLVLSAFSEQFKTALLTVQEWPTYTLDIDPNTTGISWTLLEEVVHFCYTGQCRFSERLLSAASDLGCMTLTAMLEKAKKDASSSPSPSYLDDQVLVDEYHAANFLDALYQMKMDGAFIDCLFIQKDHRSEFVRLHRLVLCAYARHLENTLREEAKRSLQVSIVILEPRATILDLRFVVDFFYMGYVRAARKRLRSTRAAAAYLGVERLMGEIDVLLSNGVGEEEGVQHGQQQQQQAHFEEVHEIDYGEETSAVRAGPSMMTQHQQEEEEEEEEVLEDEYSIEGEDDMERMMQSPYEEYDYEQEETPQRQQQQPQRQPPQHMQPDPSDVVGSSIEEHSRIYEYFVEGPKRNKRASTYHRTNQVKVKGPTVMVQENDEGREDDLQAVSVALAPPKRRRRETDEYGYGLPQIHTASEVTVPLVVGDQQMMMDRPHKCPYCDHRAKEKSAVDKHIRCKHTHETPFKCQYCELAFTVQSNLVRHIRAHTGVKPYKCTQCGQAYADKKNMDAHLYRDHLKWRQFPCDYPICSSKFWRKDRYFLHYTKMHGPLPPNQSQDAGRVGWGEQ